MAPTSGVTTADTDRLSRPTSAVSKGGHCASRPDGSTLGRKVRPMPRWKAVRRRRPGLPAPVIGIVRRGIFRLDGQGLPEVLGRLLELPLLDQRPAQVAVHVGVARLELEGSPEMPLRFRAPPDHETTQVVVGRPRGMRRRRVAPQALRVRPDVDLLPLGVYRSAALREPEHAVGCRRRFP
jgi:hypothetical protein